MKLTTAEKNGKDAVEYLLKEANVNVSSIGLEEELIMHPDFPSLAAISDALNEWNIPNMAMRISEDKLRLIPLPALVYLSINGGIFAPIKSATQNNITWLDTQNGWQNETFTDFTQKWDGTTLLIEPKYDSGEYNYRKNNERQILSNLRIPLLIGGITILLIALVILKNIDQPDQNYQFGYFAYIIIKILGTIITSILIQSTIDKNNSIIGHLCPIGDRTSCKNVLNSKAAYLFPWLSWSEIGLFYFSGSLLSLLIGSQSEVIFLFTCLALPFTVWSILHQGFVAKEWCVLCVIVQVLLWAEFIVGYSMNLQIPSTGDKRELLVILISFSVAPIIWTYIKPNLEKSYRLTPSLRAMAKLKFNPEYLQSISHNSHHLPPVFEGMKVIELGNKNAKNVLIVVANPTCSACARNHDDVVNLLKRDPDIKCQIILAANSMGNELADVVARKILNLPDREMGQALKDWFSSQNLKRWLSNLSDPDVNCSPKSLEMSERWLHLARINKAPTIFMNEIEYPSAYTIKDSKKIFKILQTHGFANQV